MSRRRSLVTRVIGAAIFAAAALGCGPSEEEHRAKLRELESIKGQLAAEQSQNRKAKGELDEAAARIEQLKNQLAAAGVDLSNLNANVEQQARALEDYRRRVEQQGEIKKRFELLRTKLQPLAKLGLTVTTRHNRMLIQLPGDVLFESSRETLKKEGQELLLKVAEVIRSDASLAERSFQVAGHADSAPLKGARFKDTWGLSVMRAREVLMFLVQPAGKGGGGLDAGRWSAAGYGDKDPVKPHDTPENEQANRRCELVLVPDVEEVLDLKSLAQ